MISLRYNYLTPSVQDTKGKEGRTKSNRTTIKTQQAESEKNNFFPKNSASLQYLQHIFSIYISVGEIDLLDKTCSQVGKQWSKMSFHRNADYFVEISVHQTPQRCCRLDIQASLQHLQHSSVFIYRWNWIVGQDVFGCYKGQHCYRLPFLLLLWLQKDQWQTSVVLTS